VKPTHMVAILGLGLGLVLAGCASPRSAGGGGSDRTVYQLKQHFPLKCPMNYSEATLRASVLQAHKAILAGMADLRIAPITNRVDNISAQVDALFSDKTDLNITLQALSPEMCVIQIRCGMFDDAQRSEMLFRAIEKHL